MTAGEVLVDSLIDWGVEIVFGLPGDGINGIMEALRTRQEKIRFVQVRHEESAAFMACAYAKYTGKLGVCLATSGPGGIHLLNGLYDAKLDGQPVLAITGMQFHDLIGTYTQQDVALDRTLPGCCRIQRKNHGTQPRRKHRGSGVPDCARLPRRGPHYLSRSTFRNMNVKKQASLQTKCAPSHLACAGTNCRNCPARVSLHTAADILNAGKKVAILAGHGALHAGPQLERVAEMFGAPIIKALLREGLRSRRQSLHHRRNRTPGHDAFAGGDGELRHAFDRGQLVSLHRVYAQAGSGSRRPNRFRSQTRLDCVTQLKSA